MSHTRDPRVMCRDHGRLYDAASEAGCVVCRGEQQPEAPEPAYPWRKLAAGAIAIFVLGSFFLGVESGSQAPKAHQVLAMKANPYRQVIEKLEYVLYAESSYGEPDAREIVFLVEKLAGEMREWESRIHMLSHIGIVREFGDWVERRSEPDFDDAALLAARRQWEGVRARVFDPEDWFLGD